jgi:hypothetical protein
MPTIPTMTLDRRIHAGRAMQHNVAVVEQVGPAGLFQQIDDGRAFRIDEVDLVGFRQHQRFAVLHDL